MADSSRLSHSRSVSTMVATLVLMCGFLDADEEVSRAEAEARVKSKTDEASALFEAGKFAEAQDQARLAVEIAVESLGAHHPLLVASLSWLGAAQHALGNYQGAQSTHERALSISEEIHGPADMETARCVNNVAMAVERLGDLKRARSLYERSLAIREKALGPDDPSVAKAMSNLATLLEELGELREAKSLLERAVSIQEKTVGPEDVATAMSLDGLAWVLRGMGDLLGAKSLCERVVRIHEKRLGPDHPETITSVSTLAVVLYELGDLRAARLLHERCHAIWAKTLGPDHPAVGTALTNLAFVAKSEGALDTARAHFERALEIREKSLGPNHPKTAVAFNHLASLHQELGDWRSAKRLHERALAIHERTYGPDHPTVAMDLTHVAADHEAMGELDTAEALYQRALELQEKKLGPDHLSVAWTRFDLGYLLRTRGKLEEAREQHERALAIREKRLGPDHRDVATSLSELGALNGAAGDLKARKELLARALSIREKAYGPNHPATTAALTNVAMAMLDVGEREAAVPMLDRAWSTSLDFLETLLPALSSRERQSFLRSQARNLGCRLRAFAGEPMKSWAAALAWKGAAQRASAATLRMPNGTIDEEAHLAEELYQARRALAAHVLSPSAESAAGPEVAERFHALQGRVDELERALGKRRQDFVAGTLLTEQAAEVLKAIDDGTVLVDILENDGWVHAWVIRRGANVASSTLGRACDLASMALRFREALERDDVAAWRESGRSLREALRRALDSSLVDASELLVCPDGALATIPWGLLPEGDGFLMQKLTVTCVNGGGSLAQAAEAWRDESTAGLFALGGVDYSALNRPYPSLEGTKLEVEVVASRFRASFADAPCRIAMGKEGDEGTFCSESPNSRFVHVATHGFFDLEKMRVVVDAATRGVSGKSASPLASIRTEELDLAGWNPLLLSGLVLAPSQEGDGYLTAEELQGLDLRGVQLVVLSACETGRGELAAGEGVLGLSRALAIAGARQFMLSLWKVPDAETSELMDAFYQGLWEDGLPAEEALRRAQLAMLARDREKGVFRPSTWGAWVLTR